MTLSASRRRRLGLCCWITAVLLALPMDLQAASIRVTVRGIGLPSDLAFRVQRLDENRDWQDVAVEPRSQVPADGSGLRAGGNERTVVLHVGPGTYRIRAAPDGWWSPPTAVTLDEQRSQVDVELPLWRVGTVRARLQPAVGEAFPREGRVIVRATGGGSDEKSALDGVSFPCDFTRRDTIQCSLPATKLHVRVRFPGHVSHFLPGVTIKPHSVTDLGTLELRRGATLFGLVETADLSPIPENVWEVRLSPTGKGQPVVSSQRRVPDDRMRATLVDANGFFSFQELAPGSYEVSLDVPGFSPVSRSAVTIVPGAEAEIREPLVLHRPVTMHVHVSPEVAPDGLPWHLDLSMLDSGGTHLQPVAEGRVDEEGWWSAERIPAAQLLLRVGTADRHYWHEELLAVRPEMAPIIVEIPVIAVDGEITLGGDPLAARLTFVAHESSRSVELESGADGSFSGHLPRTGEWSVTVTADVPSVDRSLPGVEVRETLFSSAARVEIRLPDTSVRGSVVNSENIPVSRAVVTVVPEGHAERASQAIVDRQGRFELRGLRLGRHQVYAEANEKVSPMYVLYLREDLESPDLRLVISDPLVLSGRVTHLGQPVPGARVLVMAIHELQRGYPFAITDGNGEFDVALPEGSREVLVRTMAPGFSLQLRRIRVTPDASLLLELDQLGGTLVLTGFDSEGSWPKRPSPPDYQLPLLLSDGGYLSIPDLIGWGIANRQDPTTVSSEEFRVPNLESGHYRLCFVPMTDVARALHTPPPAHVCNGGFLPPMGELRLVLPALP